MPLQSPRSGTAKEKRNCWYRGNGAYSMRGELRRGISMRKKQLNRKVRHSKQDLQNADYKRLSKTIRMVDFS